jgi:ABC-type Fe3+ transport system substrate-binding protein
MEKSTTQPIQNGYSFEKSPIPKLSYSVANGIQSKKELYRQSGSLNVIVSMPCPLKVPFKQLFYPFAERFNQLNPTQPIFCPDITDCSPFGLDDSLKNAESEEELPDVYLTSGLSVLFSESFYDRFIDSGILLGYMEDSNAERMPESINATLVRHNIGALAFSSWGVVQDLSVSTVKETPSSWTELLNSKYQNQITVHGCHGKAGSIPLLLFLQQRVGKKAIEKFAHNIIDIRHFAQIIKRMDTSNPLRTAFNILPDVASSHIPSWKKVQKLSFEEGCPINPMILMVKRSKLKECKPLIDFFHSQPFRAMLAQSGYHMADKIEWNEKYFLPDLKRLAKDGFEQVTDDIEKHYQGSLRHDKIDERVKMI